jgi:hypothetical protein
MLFVNTKPVSSDGIGDQYDFPDLEEGTGGLLHHPIAADRRDESQRTTLS